MSPIAIKLIDFRLFFYSLACIMKVKRKEDLMTWAFSHIKPPISYVRYIEKKGLRPIHDPFIQQKSEYTKSLSLNNQTPIKSSLSFDPDPPNNNPCFNFDHWKSSGNHTKAREENTIKSSLSFDPDPPNNNPCFNFDHWKPMEDHVQAREKKKHGEQTIHAVVAGVADKCFQIKLPGEKEMNELELQSLAISANRQKILKLDVLRCEKQIKNIKTKSLQNKILELQRKDIENQSLEASTKALPSVIKKAVKALSKQGGISPRIAREHISVCTAIAIPSPMVPLRNDKNRIKAHLRWLLVDQLLQIEETCKKEIKYKKKKGHLNIDGTVNVCYTTSKLNHTSRSTDHIFKELEKPIETGIIHCQAPQWQEELEVGVERTAKKVASSIITERWKDKISRKNRRENKIQLKLKVKKETLPQTSVQTDMFQPD